MQLKRRQAGRHRRRPNPLPGIAGLRGAIDGRDIEPVPAIRNSAVGLDGGSLLRRPVHLPCCASQPGRGRRGPVPATPDRLPGAGRPGRADAPAPSSFHCLIRRHADVGAPGIHHRSGGFRRRHRRAGARRIPLLCRRPPAAASRRPSLFQYARPSAPSRASPPPRPLLSRVRPPACGPASGPSRWRRASPDRRHPRRSHAPHRARWPPAIG